MALYGYRPRHAKALWAQNAHLSTKNASCVISERKRACLARAQTVRNTRKRSLRRFKRIASVSKRRQRVTAEYREAARAFIKAARARGDVCKVVSTIPELWRGTRYGHPISARLTEVHHKRGRAGKLLMDQTFWMAISKAGHRWVHSNIEEARRRGWLCEKGLWNSY